MWHEKKLLSPDCHVNSSKLRKEVQLLEYGGQTWHEHCFLCSGCEQPLGSRSFVPDKGALYCVPCYENKCAPRCARCSKTLTQGGVTYRDQPWHRECLVCTGCKTPLAEQQFTSRDDDPYCVACFGELFAPKCSSCNRPITGGSGSEGSGKSADVTRVRLRGSSGPQTCRANLQPSSRTRWRQVCVLRRPTLAPQLLFLCPLLHLPGGPRLCTRRRSSSMPGLQPSRPLSRGS